MIIYQKSKYFSVEQAQDNLTGLSPLLVRALRARGAVTPEQIEKFLHPSAEDFHDPFLLPDMDKAVQRIHAALENGERICIFGDYDVDGICSTAMLVDYFHSVGADVGYHIPHGPGHNFGLDIHEQPYICTGSKVTLQPGMVHTIEPGIYIPGIGGVRQEDDFLITEDGYRRITNITDALITL